MKKKTWILIAVAFAAVMILAAVLYPKLAKKHDAPEKKKARTESTAAEEVVQVDDFTVYDAQMNEVKLSDSFGKPIVVNFWASWCGPCKSELPAFQTLYEKYHDEVVFLMVNLTDNQVDTVSSIQAFVADNGYSFPVYYDVRADAANTYGVYSIPETVFIYADGSLCDTRIGAMDEATAEDYIKQLLGE